MVNPCDFNLSGMHGWLAHPQRMRDYSCLSTRFSQCVLKHVAISGVWNTVYLHLFCYSSFRDLDPASILGLIMSTVQGQEDKYQKPPNMMKYTVYMSFMHRIYFTLDGALLSPWCFHMVYFTESWHCFFDQKIHSIKFGAPTDFNSVTGSRVHASDS